MLYALNFTISQTILDNGMHYQLSHYQFFSSILQDVGRKRQIGVSVSKATQRKHIFVFRCIVKLLQ